MTAFISKPKMVCGSLDEIPSVTKTYNENLQKDILNEFKYDFNSA